MDELLEILGRVKPGVDFKKEKKLVDDKILTSLDIVALVYELNKAFDIRITPLDLLPENFQSTEAIWELVGRKQED